jgi:hypothetical protein
MGLKVIPITESYSDYRSDTILLISVVGDIYFARGYER